MLARGIKFAALIGLGACDGLGAFSQDRADGLERALLDCKEQLGLPVSHRSAAQI